MTMKTKILKCFAQLQAEWPDVAFWDLDNIQAGEVNASDDGDVAVLVPITFQIDEGVTKGTMKVLLTSTGLLVDHYCTEFC